MPTYEYECRSCNARFERSHGMTDSPVSKCPSCGAEVRKVFHSPGMVVKGNGGGSCAAGRDTSGQPCCMGGSCGMFQPD